MDSKNNKGLAKSHKQVKQDKRANALRDNLTRRKEKQQSAKDKKTDR